MYFQDLLTGTSSLTHSSIVKKKKDCLLRHLFEQGVDIVTIKEQLGHAHIQTTMMYLHVAKIHRSLAHNPFDRLYGAGQEARL